MDWDLWVTRVGINDINENALAIFVAKYKAMLSRMWSVIANTRLNTLITRACQQMSEKTD